MVIQWESLHNHHVGLGQIDHYKWMIIIANSILFIFHADYHLIDVCIFLTWI